MKKRLALVIIGTTALALSACNNRNEDAVQNAELNQPDAEQLHDLANEAALDAANEQAEAVVNVQNKVGDENAAAENVTNPAEADEQNVSGM